jgi:hypothetical protein
MIQPRRRRRRRRLLQPILASTLVAPDDGIIRFDGPHSPSASIGGASAR